MPHPCSSPRKPRRMQIADSKEITQKCLCQITWTQSRKRQVIKHIHSTAIEMHRAGPGPRRGAWTRSDRRCWTKSDKRCRTWSDKRCRTWSSDSATERAGRPIWWTWSKGYNWTWSKHRTDQVQKAAGPGPVNHTTSIFGRFCGSSGSGKPHEERFWAFLLNGWLELGRPVHEIRPIGA